MAGAGIKTGRKSTGSGKKGGKRDPWSPRSREEREIGKNAHNILQSKRAKRRSEQKRGRNRD